MGRDGRILFAARISRMFAYGFLSIVLVLYLSQIGLAETAIGLLITLTLAGDTAVSLWITANADRVGRKRMLIAGALLMLGAGAAFASTDSFPILLAAATIGVISPSGNEVGPFLAIEQASLAQVGGSGKRTGILAWYNLAGSFATACGALCGGGLAQALQGLGLPKAESYRAVVLGYAAFGAVLLVLFSLLSPAIEAPRAEGGRAGRSLFGLHRSRGVVLRLSALFSLDAFAGGFVVQGFVAFWFHARFGVEPAALGAIFFGANVLAGLSALSASRIAARIGLVRTMVFTHLPSNVLLVLVPLMPNLGWAIALLLLRFSISQMDVPTRQSYTMAVVESDERAAAAGLTGVARSSGAALSPSIAGAMMGMPALASLPFAIAGGLKIVYDLLLYRSFKSVKPPEERPE
jgi:MFS family permease